MGVGGVGGVGVGLVGVGVVGVRIGIIIVGVGKGVVGVVHVVRVGEGEGVPPAPTVPIAVVAV